MPRRDRIPPRSDCFFGLHFDLHPQASDTALGRDVSLAMLEALLERTDPDYVQYDCKGHAGYTGYPTEVGWASPGIVKDSLAIWRQATRERNVGLYIHYSGVWDTVAIEHHPEWAVIGADGERDPNSTSVFGPYVDELFIPEVKEVIQKYDIDGIWADGECWAAKLDWCEAAQDRFREETGLADVPHAAGEPNWAEWKAFHRRAFEEYLRHWVDALHSFRPSFQITSNWMYTPHSPIAVTADLDYLSGDYSPTASVDRARVEARYLAGQGMPWDLMAWGFNWVDGTRHSLKTSEHLMQEAAVVLMQGGGFQIYNQPTRSGAIAPFMVETLGEVADFCRERQAVCHKSETVPQVALLLSTATWAERCEGVFTPAGLEPIEGALHALLESHCSVDLLSEHRLQPRLSEYPLVVLPECNRLTDEFRAALLDYVRGGGSLLLLGAEPARLFEEHLGVTLGEEYHSQPELAVGEGSVSVMGPWLEATPTAAKALGLWYPERTRDPDEAHCAATVARLGEGQLAAVYGPLASTYFRAHHPYVREALAEIVAVLFPSAQAELEGPPSVDLSVRRAADGRLTVHLLNTRGVPFGNRTVTDDIPEQRDLVLRVRLGEPPTRVLLEPSGERLPWRYDERERSVEVRVPRLAIHGVVVFE